MYRLSGIKTTKRFDKRHTMSSAERIMEANRLLDQLQDPQYDSLRHDFPSDDNEDADTGIDPYDPHVPITVRRRYKRSIELQHAIPSSVNIFRDLQKGSKMQTKQRGPKKSIWDDFASVLWTEDFGYTKEVTQVTRQAAAAEYPEHVQVPHPNHFQMLRNQGAKIEYQREQSRMDDKSSSNASKWKNSYPAESSRGNSSPSDRHRGSHTDWAYPDQTPSCPQQNAKAFW